MQASLVHHPHTQASPIVSIVVDVGRNESRLTLDYGLTGGITDLLLPELSQPIRKDDLWRHTCFEAFVQVPADDAYVEINLSPSTEWALYRFAGYRRGGETPDVAPPSIQADPVQGQLALHASIDLAGLLPADKGWCLGLAAVVESSDGSKSYWALAHPPGPPDFHHKDCFALQLPPATQA